MKLLAALVFVLALTGCNQTDTTKNQIKDNNINTTNVSNQGQAIGKEYGGKGTGYGQIKKVPINKLDELNKYVTYVGKAEKILSVTVNDNVIDVTFDSWDGVASGVFYTKLFEIYLNRTVENYPEYYSTRPNPNTLRITITQ
jgi:hypothetical protein